MQRPRSSAPWRDSATLNAAQALLGLGLIMAGVWSFSPSAALLISGLLVWHDATKTPPAPPRPPLPGEPGPITR